MPFAFTQEDFLVSFVSFYLLDARSSVLFGVSMTPDFLTSLRSFYI